MNSSCVYRHNSSTLSNALVPSLYVMLVAITSWLFERPDTITHSLLERHNFSMY